MQGDGPATGSEELHSTSPTPPKIGTRKVDIIGNKNTKAPPDLQEKPSPKMKDAPVIADLSEIFYFSEFLNSEIVRIIWVLSISASIFQCALFSASI